MIYKTDQFRNGVIAIEERQDYSHIHWNSDIIELYELYGVKGANNIETLSETELRNIVRKVYYIIHNWKWKTMWDV